MLALQLSMDRPLLQTVGIRHQRDIEAPKPGAPTPNVTKAELRPREKDLAMYFDVKCPAAEPRIAMSSIDREIRDFLAGKSDGEDLLHALYDHVLDEPIPKNLRALLER
jgi:hypothetical protein